MKIKCCSAHVSFSSSFSPVDGHCDGALFWMKYKGMNGLGELKYPALCSHGHVMCFTLGVPLVPEMDPS